MTIQYTVVDRCLKETDEVVEVHAFDWLQRPLSDLQQQLDSFLYIESSHFERYDIDSMTIEMDDVFDTYTALFGFRVPKEEEAYIKYFFEVETNPTIAKHAILYAEEDRMFDLNITLDALPQFEPTWTVHEAIWALLQLMDQYEEGRNEAQ